MYSPMRLQALANKLVDLQVERIAKVRERELVGELVGLDAQIAYLIEEIAIATANSEAEMDNSLKKMMAQVDEAVQEMEGENGDEFHF